MSKDEYPDVIKLVNGDFNTEKQESATNQILEQWPVGMSELEESGPHARSHYQNCRDRFLGPDDDSDMTFGEIREEHGSVRNYLEQRKQSEGQIEDYMPDSLSENEQKIFRFGWMAKEQSQAER